jgi:ketosteroid isomerase-like protein
MTAANSIQQMFKQVEAASGSFFAGDPAPVMALWSRANDVTIFGGSGAYAQGWTAVGPRIEWAAAHFRGGHGTLEPVAMGESGDLAYTIYIERGEMRVEGSDELHPLALRITQIYRREDGDWKIIHRHADPLMEKSEPTWFKKGQR